MKFRLGILLTAVLFLTAACAQVEKYSSKALLKVGEVVAKTMQEKTDKASDATVFIKMNNVNRPRPWLPLETEYMSKAGIEPGDLSSNVTLLFSRGMKLLELDGTVEINGETLDFMGSGVYTKKTDIKNGHRYSFRVKGRGDADTESFTETYTGERIEILKPAAGDSLDLREGFTLEWTPGNDPERMVKVNMIMTQMSLHNMLPVLLLKDTGKAKITGDMLAESMGTAQKYLIGANSIYLERQKDEVKDLFWGDAVVSSIDSDAIPVTVTAAPSKKTGAAIPAITVTESGVTVVIAETQNLYSPIMGAALDPGDIDRIALASFAFKGVTGGSWSKSSTTESGGVKTTTTTTKSWGKDFGVPVLTRAANLMADGLMASLKSGLNADEVDRTKLVSTAAYQRMSSKEPESDAISFYVNARDLANFSSWKNIKIRVGGTENWYYDMMQKSGSDALVECYINAVRQEPETGKWDDFVFDISIDVSLRSYLGGIIMANAMPRMAASYVSEKITITENTTYEELLKAFRYEDFMKAYTAALDQWLEAVNSSMKGKTSQAGSTPI